MKQPHNTSGELELSISNEMLMFGNAECRAFKCLEMSMQSVLMFENGDAECLSVWKWQISL